MAWLEITLACTPDSYAEMETILLLEGAQAITLKDAKDQPILEPQPGETPLWDHGLITGLFTDDRQPEPIITALQRALSPNNPIDITHQILEDQPWERTWLDHFQPMCFGESLWICPKTMSVPDPDATVIYLDPGLAFGTGTHPTTDLCLQWLAKQDLKGKTLIDYGCGSGILAIAAIKLGAKKAWCVDNDPQALIATADNAKENGLNEQQIIPLLPDELPDDKADIVIANILAGPLAELAETLLEHLKPQGHIALSGILAEQSEAVMTRYESLGVETMVCKQKEDWVRLSGQFSLIHSV